MNETPQITEDAIDEIAGGYRAAQVLFTACRLNLFEQLGVKAFRSQEIARNLDLDPRGARILLDALVGLGILERSGTSYRNTSLALDCLRPGSPRSKFAQMHHGARLYDRWSGLIDSVRTGQPVPEDRIDERLQGGREAFARAMADSARQSAKLTAEKLELEGGRRLLDIGGGPGAFAIEFTRRNPDLRVEILDDAETLGVARKNIEEAGFEKQISLVPGDAFETAFDGPYDFIFISNVLHIYPPDQNESLIGKSARALAAGGTLILKDFFLESGGPEAKQGHLWSLLFAANMLVATEGGDCYTIEEAFGWCRKAGLEATERVALTEKTLLLLARRPATGG
jgi:precorrin-6B methylase 2